MDASVWGPNAQAAGYAKNTTPAVGSIAWWSYGHVAYVEGVGSGYIDISEDSFPTSNYPSGDDDRRQIQSGTSDWPTDFLHIKDVGPSPGSPIGHVDSAGGEMGTAAYIRGWVMDPDAPTTATQVHIYVDGTAGSGAKGYAIDAAMSRPDVAAAYPGSSAEHGFDASIPMSAGAHTLYVYGINIAGGGSNILMKTVGVTVSARPAGSPFGDLNDAEGLVGGKAHVRGWTLDPDAMTTPTVVHLYIDGIPGVGQGRNLGLANSSRPDVAAAYSGANAAHGFDTTISGLTPGEHILRLYAINLGSQGENAFFEAVTIHVPGPSPIGNVDSVGSELRAPGAFIRGWVMDPDAPTTATQVHIYVDGKAGSGAKGYAIDAAMSRPDVAAAYPGSSAEHGFDASIPMSAGAHTLYVYGINIAGGGSNNLLEQVQVTVAATPAGSPFGDLNSAEGRVGGIAHVHGWTLDPDALTTPTTVHLYVDGPAGVGTGFNLGLANLSRPDVAAAYSGANAAHGFDTTISGLTPGQHILRLYAINLGSQGGNAFFEAVTIHVPVPPPPPANTALPKISGTAKVGSTLSCSTGSWSNSPTNYARQWLKDGSAISSATASTRKLVSADAGHKLSCRVTASNAGGSKSATSSSVSVKAATSSSTGPATGSNPATSVSSTRRCVVPKLRGVKLVKARKRLAASHCRVGKITRKHSTKVKKGRVISSKPKPGSHRKNKAKVALVVSQGRS